jgi:phosphatidylserine decarboxylase
MKNQHTPFAREGYPFIGVAVFVMVVFALLGWGLLTVVSLALMLFTAWFFRNPERVPPQTQWQRQTAQRTQRSTT